MLDKLREIRKAVATGIGSLLAVLSFVAGFSGLLPTGVAATLGTVIAALTTFMTWLVPNEAADEATDS